MPVPVGNEAARPFLPTKDLAKSKAFYEALGFTKILDGDIGIFEIGHTGFILQALYDEKWAEHTMMHLLVDDLDAWWAHIQSLDLPGKFGVPAPKPPAMQPWGLRIVYLVDPAGILWHIAQRPTNGPSE
jgi:catechol 2,3-dioxygenase-like lactoylglutathione lyase family enzyme